MPRRVEYIHYPGGVRVSRHPDGRGTYRIRFPKADGTEGDARRSDWREADELARELAGLVSDNNHPVGGTVDATDDDATVADAVEVFLDPSSHREPMSASYLSTATSHARRHIVPAIGDVPCSQWDRGVSERVVDHCTEAGLAPSTVNTVVGLLSAVATSAERHGMLPAGRSPVRGIHRRRSEPVDLTDLPEHRDIEKAATALVELTGDGSQALQAYVAAYSGLRLGEMLGLQCGDVDLEEGTIRVSRQLGRMADGNLIPPKTGKARVTIFPAFLDDAWEAAVAGRDPDRPVWPGEAGGHLPHSSFRTLWNRAITAAGWPRAERGFKWRYHDLRHYFCTWALAADGLGLDVADVSRFAGHSNPQITWQVYVQSRPDRVSRARAASRKAAR